MTHTKPTPEELEANIAKAAAELDELDPGAKDVVTDDAEVEDSETDDVISDDDASDGDDTEEKVVTSVKKESGKDEKKTITKEDPADPDYKEKFAQSTRENQLQAARNKKLSEALAKVGEDIEITDEDVKKEYSDFDEMTDREKRFAKDTLINKRRFDAIKQVNSDFKNLEAWEQKVDSFIDDPESLTKNPQLEGRQAEFKAFAAKESRINVDFEDLVSAFLFKTSGTKTKNKGGMFERGTGGANDKQKPRNAKISIEAAAQLRQNNYKEYSRLLREGKIDTESI